MKRTSFTTILRQSANDILDSLDMRPHTRYVPARRGQSVEHAWTATGSYLRKALDHYGQQLSSRSDRTR
jgi:hypothetical protein